MGERPDDRDPSSGRPVAQVGRAAGRAPTVTVAWLCGAAERGERVRAARQQVVVTDHGTGAGPDLACLFVSAAEADRLAPPEARNTDILPTLELHLRPVVDSPDLVEIIDPARAPDRRSVRPRRVRVADQLLARFTHQRLDRASIPPTLHGGAAADPNGRTALVLGCSGAGKSTLIAHLVHHGLDLVNDEQVTLHPGAGVIAGFTRPISVKPGGLARLPETTGPVADGEFGALVTAAQLGGHHRLTGAPALLVLPERSADHETPVVEPLTPGEAIEAMCANNLDLAAKPVRALEAFAWLAAGTVAVRLRYEDSSTAAGAVVDLLRDAAAPAAAYWSVAAGARPGDGSASGLAPSSEVIAVTIGDELVAYQRASRAVIRLDAAGAAVWRSLPGRAQDAASDHFVADLARLGFLS